MIKHSMKWAAAAAALVTLSACATATPYAPAGEGSRYGYAEQRIDTHRYRVSFSGNSVTSREQVESALLLRAAEITLQNGGDWFSTVNRSTDRDVRLQATPDLFSRSPYGPYWGPSWRYHRRGFWSPWNDPFWGRPSVDVREIDRYEATAEILVGTGRKPADDDQAFDAREVTRNLGRLALRAG
jgi:hypothetical protein